MAFIQAQFFSETLGMCTSAGVVMPQNPTQPRGHKTLYLLHGASDDHTAWMRRTSIERYAAQYDLCVVMPDAQLSRYCDMAHGLNFYTYIARELPSRMRTFFPLSDAREDNFIAGLSMGGAGALKIGLGENERFSVIGCLSAGASNFQQNRTGDPAYMKRMINAYGENADPSLEMDSVLSLATRILDEGSHAPRIYHACGRQDFLLENAHVTRDFFQNLPGNPFNYVYVEDPGAHTWDYWDRHIQAFLKFAFLP